MFYNAQNIAILGGTFTEVHVHELKPEPEPEPEPKVLNGRQILSQSHYVVHGAIHDSGQRYPPSECHPGTREDILDIALDWVDKPLDKSESQVFWLSGPAGVGKTAIAQALCQRLKELGRLGGDFFLSRSVTGHSNLHTLFPTLAYQLAEIYPEFGHELDTIILKVYGSILTKNMELQLEHLIINPLKRATHNKFNIPLVVVIDGLDEAGGENDQILLLRLLGSSLRKRSLPLKIFLTSRPEPWIETAFRDNLLLGRSLRHFLRQTSQTDNDIRTFLKSEFTRIQQTHDLMKNRYDTWPCSEVIDDIVDRASGQFIYAATILKYIEDPNGKPAERLQSIVNTSFAGNHEVIGHPFLALDNLYKHILSTSLNVALTLTILGGAISTTSGPKRSEIPYLRTVTIQLRHEVTRIESKTDSKTDSGYPIDRMERILGLRADDGLLAVRTIQSLVDISTLEDGIKFYHKSFPDFLLDHNRSGSYFIDMNQVNSKLMEGALKLHRCFEQSYITPENRKKFERDLQAIRPQWVKWWLRSAKSDEDRLLREIKAIDKAAFYRSYTGNVALKVLFLFNTYSININSLKKNRSPGNIAESISQQVERRAIPTLALERFLATQSVLDKNTPRDERFIIYSHD